jgi:predicted RNase H-like HicB family nuclease
MKYVYPVIFTPAEDGGYLIAFPDFPRIHTDGDSLTDAFDMAEDALNLWLWNAEEEKQKIPVPSDLEKIPVPEGSLVSLVKADTLAYRKHNDTQAIKKTLSIPRWLDTLAKEQNVNFSNILQNALIKELKINEG